MKKDIRIIKAIGAAILGNSFFGLSFLFSKVALERMEPFVLLSVRFIMAFVILNIVMLTGKIKIRLTGKPVHRIVLLGLVQPILYFTFENYGIKGTSTAFAGTLLAIVPVITLLAGVIFGKEIPLKQQIIGSVLSVIGVAMISMAQQKGSTEIMGVVFLFCAVFSSVGYNLLMKNTADSFTSFERTYVMIALGSVFFTCFAMFRYGGDISLFLQPLIIPEVLGSVFYLAAFSSVGAFFLLNYAFSYLNLAQASIFTNLVSVVSIAAGIIFLGESFTFMQGIGSGAILTGVYMSNMSKRISEEGK